MTEHEINNVKAEHEINDLINQNPTNDWDAEKLGQFALALGRRTAVDIWRVGRALSFAKGKFKGKKGWEKWARQWVPFLSKTTRNRYLEVALLPLEVVEDKTINEVYVILGFKEKEAPAAPPAQTPTPATENKTPSSTTPAADPTPIPDIHGQDADTSEAEDEALRKAEEQAEKIVTTKGQTYRRLYGAVEDIAFAVGAKVSEQDIEDLVRQMAKLLVERLLKMV